MSWTLVGADGRSYESAVPGRLGGHRRSRIYGRLDCPSALRALRRSALRQAQGTGCGTPETDAQAPGTASGMRGADGGGRGGYEQHRVFFADEQAAVAAGYRPCAVCLPREYARWKARAKAKLKPRRAG